MPLAELTGKKTYETRKQGADLGWGIDMSFVQSSSRTEYRRKMYHLFCSKHGLDGHHREHGTGTRTGR